MSDKYLRKIFTGACSKSHITNCNFTPDSRIEPCKRNIILEKLSDYLSKNSARSE